MANNAKRGDNKNKIIGICCGVVVVILLVVAIVVAVIANTGYSDAYFESDGTKYVLTIDNTEGLGDGEELGEDTPLKSHYVYYYNGDSITEVKLFSEFTNEDAAKTAYDELVASEEDVENGYKAIELNGKYVILTFLESDYEGMTASDIKAQIDLINNSSDQSTEESTEETTVEATDSGETVETTEETTK